MRVLTAEVEKTTRTIVKVNIDKLLTSDWAADRSKYDSDEDFAKDVLRQIGTHDLLDPCDEDEIGIAVEGEFDDAEMSFVGVHDA